LLFLYQKRNLASSPVYSPYLTLKLSSSPSGANNIYVVNVSLGNVTQNFSFAYDTALSTSYVGNKTACDGCSVNLFNSSNSNTFVPNGTLLNISQPTVGNVNGTIGTDRLLFNTTNTTIQNFSFSVAYFENVDYKYDGVLGLGYTETKYSNGTFNSTSSVLKALVASVGSNVSSNVFVQRVNQSGAYLFLGGIPSDVQNADRAVCQLYTNATSWACNITEVLIKGVNSSDWNEDNSYKLSNKASTVAFSTLASHVVAPNETLSYFTNKFNSSLNNKTVCSLIQVETGIKGYVCNKTLVNLTNDVNSTNSSDVHLVLSNNALKINSSDLFSTYPNDTTKYLFNILFFNDNTTSQFVVGQLLLKNYDVVFNMDLGQIEFRGDYHNYSAGKVMMWIIIGIAILVVLVIVIFVSCYCCRKGSAEDYQRN